jgi:hypothetical protein
MKRIEQSAFENCQYLTNVEFGNSLEYIGASAFESCALTMVILPETLTYIGAEAFAWNLEMKKVYIPKISSDGSNF